MAFKYFDRVQETSSTTGTGTVALGGAVTGFVTFASVYSNSDTMFYCITDQAGSNWEVGLGTYTSSGNGLARTSVLASTNSGSLVNFTSGALYVFTTIPAGAIGGTNINSQIFSSSGTFTTPSYTNTATVFKVTCVGSGGNGNIGVHSGATDSTNTSFGTYCIAASAKSSTGGVTIGATAANCTGDITLGGGSTPVIGGGSGAGGNSPFGAAGVTTNPGEGAAYQGSSETASGAGAMAIKYVSGLAPGTAITVTMANGTVGSGGNSASQGNLGLVIVEWV